LQSINVAEKAVTRRTAIAESRIRMSAVTFDRLRSGDSPKGNVLATARLAGIMAAQRTAELIPLRHPLHLSGVDVDCALLPDSHSVATVARPEAGAIASFSGVVRNHANGRTVTLLEYETYPSMAEKEITLILDAIEAELDDVRLAVLHRVGALHVWAN
jgi:molybdenum cofactor biosynthesis protein MoaC